MLVTSYLSNQVGFFLFYSLLVQLVEYTTVYRGVADSSSVQAANS